MCYISKALDYGRGKLLLSGLHSCKKKKKKSHGGCGCALDNAGALQSLVIYLM